jgi:hypothetical protein
LRFKYLCLSIQVASIPAQLDHLDAQRPMMSCRLSSALRSQSPLARAPSRAAGVTAAATAVHGSAKASSPAGTASPRTQRPLHTSSSSQNPFSWTRESSKTLRVQTPPPQKNISSTAPSRLPHSVATQKGEPTPVMYRAPAHSASPQPCSVLDDTSFAGAESSVYRIAPVITFNGPAYSKPSVSRF